MNRTVGIVIVLLVVLGVAIFINAQRKDTEEWKDGTYVARSDPDERGYYGEIEIVIRDGKISRADYEENDQAGKPKGKDYPYQAGPQSHPKLEERLIEAQNPDKVEVISGATQTHERFQQAARRALQKAEEGDQSRPPMPKPPMRPETPTTDDTAALGWKDGMYTAQTEPDSHGYHGDIEIVISNGKITRVSYDEKDQEGKAKGEDYPYPLGPESEDKYEQRLMETQDPDKVEVITGATETWERFKDAAQQALKKAK